jgi:hypothetical protein
MDAAISFWTQPNANKLALCSLIQPIGPEVDANRFQS